MSGDGQILGALERVGDHGMTVAGITAATTGLSSTRILFGLKAMADVRLVVYGCADRRWRRCGLPECTVEEALLIGAAAVRRARRHDPTIDAAGLAVEIATPFDAPGPDE